MAVPALGTGGLNYPPVEVAKATIEAVALHNLQYGEETSIEKVNIVLLDSDIELIKVSYKNMKIRVMYCKHP